VHIDFHHDPAANSGFHLMDPRLKLLGCGIFLAATSLVTSPASALCAVGMACVLVAYARFPFGFVLRRLRPLLLFLSTFFLILPFSHPMGVQAGATQAGVILLKGTAMILTIFPMFSTSPLDQTLKAMERLKVSRKLITLFFFTFRYLTVYADQLQTIRIALQSRGFKPKGNLSTLRTFGNLIGSLLVRSFEQTERIYQAMISRGYTDHFITLYEFSPLNRVDGLKFGLLTFLSLFLILLDQFLRGGLPWIR
jgi:cobalt/nickel transport system permease protein